MRWTRHICRMPLRDGTGLWPGCRWTCSKCGQVWEARAFLGAFDDLRMVRVKRAWRAGE